MKNLLEKFSKKTITRAFAILALAAGLAIAKGISTAINLPLQEMVDDKYVG